MSKAFDKVVDARGMNCPMPLVNAREGANEPFYLTPGVPGFLSS